jgi:hypothetical protein
MKSETALKIAQFGAVVIGAIVLYRVVSSGAKTAAAVGAAVADIVKKDLNPASTENIVYKNIPVDVQRKIGDVIGPIIDKVLGRSYKTAPSATAPAPVDVKADFRNAEKRAEKSTLGLDTITGVSQITYDQLGNPINSNAPEFTGGATGEW